MKVFTLLEPSVADPEGLILSADVSDLHNVIRYGDYEVISAEIEKRKAALARREGVRHEWLRVVSFLESKGWTHEQIQEMSFWSIPTAEKTDGR
jgi:hypothetical protein